MTDRFGVAYGDLEKYTTHADQLASLNRNQ